MEEKKQVFIYNGEPVDLTAPMARLDFQSPLEVGLIVFAIMAGIFFFPMVLSPIPKSWSLIPLGTCFIAIFAYKNTDCTYLIDNMRKCIDYSRTFFGSTSRSTVCRFDQIHCVTVNGNFIKTKHSSWWAYGAVIVTTKGKMIKVSDEEREALEKANNNAMVLATHLGAEYVPGQHQRNVKVEYSPGTATVSVEFVPHQVPWKIVLIAVAICLIIPLIVTGAILVASGL